MRQPLTRYTPLPNRSKPINRQSTKQRKRQADLAKLKRQIVTEQIEAFGFAACEDCPTQFYSLETALAGLQAHHVTFRSRGGTDERKNLALCCFPCHEARHGIKVVRKWNQMPMDEGGFDDDDYWEAVRLEAEDR